MSVARCSSRSPTTEAEALDVAARGHEWARPPHPRGAPLGRRTARRGATPTPRSARSAGSWPTSTMRSGPAPDPEPIRDRFGAILARAHRLHRAPDPDRRHDVRGGQAHDGPLLQRGQARARDEVTCRLRPRVVRAVLRDSCRSDALERHYEAALPWEFFSSTESGRTSSPGVKRSGCGVRGRSPASRSSAGPHASSLGSTATSAPKPMTLLPRRGRARTGARLLVANQMTASGCASRSTHPAGWPLSQPFIATRRGSDRLRGSR